MYSIFLVTRPPRKKAARQVVRDILEAAGGFFVGDGACILLSSQALLFESAASHIRSECGEVIIRTLQAEQPPCELSLDKYFKQDHAYAQWRRDADRLERVIDVLPRLKVSQACAELTSSLQRIIGLDIAPGRAKVDCETRLASIREKRDARLSIPRSQDRLMQDGVMPDSPEHAGTRWSTITNSTLDGSACEWLITRRIDLHARVTKHAAMPDLAEDTLTFGYPEAQFRSDSGLTCFDVLVEAFSVESDDEIKRIGRMVRSIEGQSMPDGTAEGVATLRDGLQELIAADVELVPKVGAALAALSTAILTPEPAVRLDSWLKRRR